MAMIRNSQVLRVIPFLISICLSSLPAHAKYSGGMGEVNNPYQIATAEDLMLLGETPDDYNKYFIMTADIDLDPNLPGRKVFNKAIIGSFIGIFDGNGYTISHMTIIGGGHLGLFGILQPKAKVRNLGIVNVQVLGSGCSVGGLVGSNHGVVTYCYSTGQVNGNEKVGGLVGANCGEVTNSYSCCKISGDSFLGGLVGVNYIEVLYYYSFSVFSGCINQCYSTGAVGGTGGNIGGLVSDNGSAFVHGIVNASFWDVETSGLLASDGGIGRTTAEMQTISNFLEADWDFINETANGIDEIWKISEGLDYPRLWWEKYSGGTGEPNDPYQIATAEDLMQLGETPEDYDKHFILTADIDLDPNLPGRKVFDKAVFAAFTNSGRWSIQLTPFVGVFDGNGHTISHLTIEGNSNLGLFNQLGFGAEVINLSLVDVSVSGSGEYIGGLTGSNGSYNSDGGLVTRCHSSGTVTGSRIVGGLVGDNFGSITSSYSTCTVRGGPFVGGLIGGNGVTDYPVSGILTNCYSSGTVSGERYVGGLAGYSHGSITTSFSTGTVTGNVDVGGLVGQNWGGSITNSYSTGAVSGDYCVGGLSGKNYHGTITNSYSNGTVIGNNEVGGLVGDIAESSITMSFWDMETSGQTNSAGGTGKTTAEMQTATTFLEAGWDFVDETVNGPNDIWKISEGLDYPRLWWEAK